MTTACPHCQKEIQNSYCLRRLNAFSFPCPYCLGRVALKGAPKLGLYGGILGLLASALWIGLKEFGVLDSGWWLVPILGFGLLAFYYQFSKRPMVLAPITLKTQISEIRFLAVTLLILPAIFVLILGSATFGVEKLMDKSAGDLEKLNQYVLNGLENGSLSAQKQSEMLRHYAKVTRTDYEFVLSIRGLLSHTSLVVTVASVISLFGIILVLNRVREIAVLGVQDPEVKPLIPSDGNP